MVARKNSIERRKLTPPEVAAMYGVSSDKVPVWIRSGELRAINAATSRNGRPRYLIDVDDLRGFEERRSVQPPTRRPVRRCRKLDVIEFF